MELTGALETQAGPLAGGRALSFPSGLGKLDPQPDTWTEPRYRSSEGINIRFSTFRLLLPPLPLPAVPGWVPGEGWSPCLGPGASCVACCVYCW